MKFFYLFIAVTLSCSISAQNVKGLNQSKKDTGAEKALIIKIERERVKSLVDANITIAQQLHANDFQLITPKGNSLSKQQYLGMIGAGYLKYNWEPGDITVKMYDTAAVIRYTDKIFQVTVNSKPADNGKFTHTNLYEKRNGRWQIVWSQASGENIPFPTMTEIAFSKKEYTLPFTQEFDFKSKVNGQEYKLMVAFPPDYSIEDTTRYNVLYILDGNDHWPIAVEAHRLRRSFATTQISWGYKQPTEYPEYIIVGIGYPVKTYLSSMPYRASDYTPTRTAFEDSVLIQSFGVNRKSGDAEIFINVLSKEIIPLIDSNYRTTTDRGIIGHSLGGEFTVYTLFTASDFFSRYGILSCNFWRDNNAMFNFESVYAKNHTDLPKRVFISRGGADNNRIKESSLQMIDTLKSHKYPGLELREKIFPDETHFSVLPVAISWALKALKYEFD